MTKLEPDRRGVESSGWMSDSHPKTGAELSHFGKPARRSDRRAPYQRSAAASRSEGALASTRRLHISHSTRPRSVVFGTENDGGRPTLGGTGAREAVTGRSWRRRIVFRRTAPIT